ncbi:Arc family DNA-binding protein [Stenotrophomonas maltophilia]|uniref:Arc family DNA-binding protein n=1 Tax=Stenotrophomonas maltophilia TaxID=40324 RepID=UPI001953D2A6|nr:Arc family DNA-binding protein [Stenotrophomonas maltophilia]
MLYILPAMARTDPQVNFRVPAELLDRLKQSAADNNRTITAELVNRLEGSFLDEDLGSAGYGMHEAQDRAAILKVLLFPEINLLRARVEMLGGREAVLLANKDELAKKVTSPRLVANEVEKRSHMSRAVATYPLTTLFTDEELDKLAERVITIQKAMGQLK